MTQAQHDRKPIMAANWKMHKTVQESVNFAAEFGPLVADTAAVDIVIAPPFIALERVAHTLEGTAIQLAAQNVNPEAMGAFTGEIAPPMLKDVGCRFAIVGHSERRALFGETSAFVARKAKSLLDIGMAPIVCVGESLAERESDRAFEVIREQLDGSLASVDVDKAAQITIAYEPVWAIGTGKTATPEIAQEDACAHPQRACKTFPWRCRGDPNPIRRLREARQRARPHGPAGHRRRPGGGGQPGTQEFFPDRPFQRTGDLAMDTFLITLHVMVCLVLIAVVLLQRGKGADMGATFGGGGSNTVFGSRGAGNFLTKLTSACAVIFMLTSLSLAYLNLHRGDQQVFDSDSQTNTEAPVKPGAGAQTDDATAPSPAASSDTLEEIPTPSPTQDEPDRPAGDNPRPNAP